MELQKGKGATAGAAAGAGGAGAGTPGGGRLLLATSLDAKDELEEGDIEDLSRPTTGA